jgi:hypothetical protein
LIARELDEAKRGLRTNITRAGERGLREAKVAVDQTGVGDRPGERGARVPGVSGLHRWGKGGEKVPGPVRRRLPIAH